MAEKNGRFKIRLNSKENLSTFSETKISQVKGRIEEWNCKGNCGFDLYGVIHPVCCHQYQVLEILYHVKLSHELVL